MVIGFGNVDRADDGIAFHIVNALREVLGQPPLIDDTGLENLGDDVDSIFLLQLMPEMIDIMVSYDNVIFVDAHVFEPMNDLHYETVGPEYGTSTFTHHITPGMMLALLKMIHGKEPTGHIVSVRGHDFDFHRTLSSKTATLIEPAKERIMQLIQRPDDGSH